MADSNHRDDEGFLALLKPIQDVTRNWDVDLSLHLEEYLNYIKEICGDKLPDMNFAQAAVLVQNSANIYSKKVDYLAMTVMELLDTITRKKKEGKGREGEDGGEEGDEAGHHEGPRRRRAAAVMFDADEFNLMDDAFTDRNITLDLEKECKKNMERKKPSIVLNPPSKSAVKTDGKPSCTVYLHTGVPLGKKEEFRLNWRISSEGMLHEEFVVNKTAIAAMEPVEITVVENGIGSGDEGDHDYEDMMGGDQGPPVSTSLLSIAPQHPDRESDVERARNAQHAGNLVEDIFTKDKTVVDDKMKEWEPNDFNNVLEDKPYKKRNPIKIPPELDHNSNKRKYSRQPAYKTFTVTDILINPGKDTAETYGKDIDFSFQSKQIMKEKKKRLQAQRLKYKDFLNRNIPLDQLPGFPKFDEDSDDDNDFEGFGAPENDDDAATEPLEAVVEPDIIGSQQNPNWNGDDPESYENEAKEIMELFNRKKEEEKKHGNPDLAKRVAEWHRKVMPFLIAAEERSSFDVQEYGSKILNHFGGNVGSTKTFAEIVSGEPQEEVSRYFLSTLLLTNQYNLEISKTTPGELDTDCIQLKLLSTVRHHEELDDNMRMTSDK